MTITAQTMNEVENIAGKYDFHGLPPKKIERGTMVLTVYEHNGNRKIDLGVKGSRVHILTTDGLTYYTLGSVDLKGFEALLAKFTQARYRTMQEAIRP